MQSIGLLIARYGEAFQKKSFSRASVAEAVSRATGIKLKPEEIDLREDGVWVRVSGVRKANLFLKKAAAESAAAEILGEKGGVIH